MELLTVLAIFVCSFIKAHCDPNIVLFLSDDQDLILNGLTPMTKTLELVGLKGKTFSNAFVNIPVCCPCRSSMLTGRYAHNTGVINNTVPGNCSSRSWQENVEPYSIAALLKNSKPEYLTFYAGKYLNQYGYEVGGGITHVPKGYDWWIGLAGNSKYYNYILSLNGTPEVHRNDANDYLTDVISDFGIDFLNNKPNGRPFFMTLAPPAPHGPFTPAPRHQNLFDGVKAVRSPSFNYTPTDKHWLVGMPSAHLPTNVTNLDLVQQHRFETLLAVDEMVERIILKLQALNELNNTYIIYTSDHGFHIGQFTQPWDKRQPYETDIRVPLLISGPRIRANSSSSHPVSAVDIAPTILHLANVTRPKNFDGKSFRQQLLNDREGSYNETIFLEYWGEGNATAIDAACPWKYDTSLTECRVNQWCKCEDSRNNTYTCFLELSPSRNFKFCQFVDDVNFVEAYDLVKDPYELTNIARTLNTTVLTKYRDFLARFRRCSGKSCQIKINNEEHRL